MVRHRRLSGAVCMETKYIECVVYVMYMCNVSKGMLCMMQGNVSTVHNIGNVCEACTVVYALYIFDV